MQTFLVIQLARFGDVIQTKRLVRTLQQRGTVHLCVDRTLAALARLVYPDVVVHGVAAHGAQDSAALECNRAVFDALAGEDFTSVYNCNHAGFNRALARLFSPEIVHGHSMFGGQAVRSPWVRMAFRWTRERCIAPLNLVDFWAWLAEDPLPPEAVNPPAKGGGRGLGVVLAGRESRRSLPPPVLAQVVHTTFEALGGPRIFLFGSAAERPAARRLLRHLPGRLLDRVCDLSGRTDWRALVEALTGLDALLTPDTGTMHLAAHLGVPVRAFFLSSAWCHETGPYGTGHVVWQSVAPCAPCLESALCSRKVACLGAFSGASFLRSLALCCNSDWLTRFDKACKHPEEMTLPLDMALFGSALDKAGGTWRCLAGEDAHGRRRAVLRRLVGEYLGIDTVRNDSDVVSELAAALYGEEDWTLPSHVVRFNL